MYFCAFSSSIDDRRIDRDVGVMLLDERDAFRRGDDADDADDARRRRAAAGRARRRRCRRWPASDRSSARSSRRAGPAASNSTATRPPSSRRAAGRCVRPARCGTSSSTASSMPSPARSTGTTTTSAPTRRPAPGRAASRRSSVVVGDVAQRLGGQQHADARRGAAEMLRRRALVAQRDQRVVHERVVDEMDRHGAHYTTDNARR